MKKFYTNIQIRPFSTKVIAFITCIIFTHQLIYMYT